MRFVRILPMALALLATGVVISCSEDTPAQPPAEFIAKDADFANFTTWTQTITPRKGPDSAGLAGGAHGDSDTSFTRYIFINSATVKRGANGEFPNGTILVKELRDSTGAVVAIDAMAKRGGEFNKSHKGWEWFTLDPATKAISTRGDTLLGNSCNSCHAIGKDIDYVFTR